MPASGIMTGPKAPNAVKAEKQFEDYMQAKTLSNWKFWIVSLTPQAAFTGMGKLNGITI